GHDGWPHPDWSALFGSARNDWRVTGVYSAGWPADFGSGNRRFDSDDIVKDRADRRTVPGETPHVAGVFHLPENSWSRHEDASVGGSCSHPRWGRNRRPYRYFPLDT